MLKSCAYLAQQILVNNLILFRSLFLLLLLCITFAASAINTLQLIDNQEVINLSQHVRLLKEAQGRLEAKQVLQRIHEFQYPIGNNPNYGFSDSAMWLHTRFINLSEHRRWVIDIGYAQLDNVEFFLFTEDGLYQSLDQGKFTEHNNFRFPTFAIELPLATPLDLFVRVQSNSSPLFVPLDLQPEIMHDRQSLYDSIFWGAFFGALGILAIYNLVIFVSVREVSSLAFVGYTAAVIFWQLVWGGYIQVFFPSPVSTWFGLHLALIHILLGIGSSLFTVSFLSVYKSKRKSRWFVWSFLILILTLAVVSALDFQTNQSLSPLVHSTNFYGIIIFLIVGFESYASGFKPARYFIFAWSIFLLCSVIEVLSIFHYLPSNSFTTYAFQAGIFLQSGLFSLALMDKSRDQLEREIQQATLDLRNNMELVEEQNARLDIARKDAVTASNIKSQFLANMSHEIRTPLNAILGFSRELHQTDLSAQTREQVRMINTSATNLLDVVNDVLDFSKIEAGKLTLNNAPFAPHQLLEDIVSVMSKSAQSHGLEFTSDYSALPEKLLGDAFRIKQILNNLLSNAVKFTAKGSVSLRVKGQELNNNLYQLVLEIEDTGIGISKQDRKKLFMAFSQLDDARNRAFQGTGLGLVICQELVKMMRGSLNLTSEPGEGSVFRITLQLNKLSNKLYPMPNSFWKDKKVVVFNPLPLDRRNTAKLFKMLGAKVFSVESVTGLWSLRGHYDALFASMPQSCLCTRESLFPVLSSFPAQQRYLTYSGPSPRQQFTQLDRYFVEQIRLPLTASSLANINKAPPPQPINELKERIKQLPEASVLAVDDMPMNLRLLETWLKESPLQLTLANSGSEAVNLCQKSEFDLILMDVQMPETDGLQATKLIRKIPINMGTPIIAVTAHAFKEEQELLLASGMDDYLAKPIELNELLRLLKTWCSNIEQKAKLATLDWQAAVKLSGSEDAAKEYLKDFCMQLPAAQQEVVEYQQANNYSELQQAIHRLHGACSYTGLPQLKAICCDIEGKLKNAEHLEIDTKVDLLINEIRLVLGEARPYFD